MSQEMRYPLLLKHSWYKSYSVTKNRHNNKLKNARRRRKFLVSRNVWGISDLWWCSMNLCNTFINKNQFILISTLILNPEVLSTTLTTNSNYHCHNMVTNSKEQKKYFHPTFPEKTKTDQRTSKASEMSKERNLWRKINNRVRQVKGL